MSPYRIVAFVHTSLSVQETSKIFEALRRLKHRGLVSYSLETVDFPMRSPRVVGLRAHDSAGSCREIAIDLMDQRDLLDFHVLESVSFYFKRSFWPDALSNVPAHLRKKIQPFGLNSPMIGFGAAIELLKCRLRSGRPTLTTDARQLFALRPFSALDRQRREKDDRTVLYQTLVWEGNDPETRAINERRYQLVRALQLRLGNRFVGGIIPTRFARSQYPDALTTFPYSMRSYSKLLRRASVGVYSEGLHASVAFKMSEYLASGCCVVADRIAAVLPRPLEHSQHFLAYGDSESCADQCERLLDDHHLASEMRRATWNYYCEEVEPGAQLLSVLARSFTT